MVSAPVKLQSECIKRLIEDTLWTHLKKLFIIKNVINSKKALDLENNSKPDVNYQV
jgi:hypothetical protein